MNPYISVVVPVYEVEEFFQDCACLFSKRNTDSINSHAKTPL